MKRRWFQLLRQARNKAARLQSEWRALGFRLRGCTIGRKPLIEAGVELAHMAEFIRLGDRIVLEHGVKLTVSQLCRHDDALVIGDDSFIGRFTQITARERVRIGRNVMIAPFCYLTEANHGLEMGVPMQHQTSTSKPIVIEDDVWLGNGCTVLPGVTIGTGAVVGANSVVSRDIPPYAVAVGSPARVIRYRDGRPHA